MASACQTENFEAPRVEKGMAFATLREAGQILETVDTGEILFHPGDRRTLYRVERGAICHYMLWSDGRHDVIEFAFPGDIIGLGHLDQNVTTAQAMVDTVVSLVSEDAFSTALQNDDRLSFRLASAVEREFEYQRDKSLAMSHVPATARVANFLLALSSLNGPEGRDPSVISDEITAGFVAEKLDLSIDKLGAALLQLKRDGAVKETASGLRILDTQRLQRAADAA
jgi:CRP/FNR family transcriptional regulator